MARLEKSLLHSKPRRKKLQKKHTTAGIRWWSPTQLLICRSEACVWQSGRDAQFSAAGGARASDRRPRNWFLGSGNRKFALPLLTRHAPIENAESRTWTRKRCCLKHQRPITASLLRVSWNRDCTLALGAMCNKTLHST